VLGFDPAGPLPRFEEFFRRIHPDDQAALSERFEQAIRDKADFELDYRVVHPEEGIRDIHAVGHAVLDGSGNLGEFVGTVIDVTERKRAEQELRQSETDLRTKNDRLKLLLNLTSQITSNLKLHELLRAVSSNIREVMQCDAVFISLVDSASGTPRLYVLDFPQSKGLIKEEIVYTVSRVGKRVLETLKPSVVDLSDPAAVPPEIYDKVIAEGLKSACLIPLVNRGRVLGGLVVARKIETSFTPADVEFLSQASGQIAIAIENAFAFQEVSGLRDRLQLLLNLTTKITSSLDLRAVLRAVAANVRELIHADAVAVSLPDAPSGKFRVFAVDFPHGRGVIKEELLYTPGAASRKAADTMKPVVGCATDVDERESSEVRNIAAAEGMKAFCLIPLVSRGRFLGILSILRTTETPFTPEDVDLLTQASGQIAIAVENALAYHEISELKNKLAQEKLYLEEEEKKLRELIETIPTHAWTALPDGSEDFVNRYWQEYSGLSVEESAGLGWQAAVHPADLKGHLEKWRTSLATGEPFENEVRYRCAADGQYRWFLARAVPLRDALGKILKWYGISIDIEDRKRAEEEIRCEMNFENIVGSSSPLKHVLELVETVAPNDSTVLLLGETGTGKELIARAIHDQSRRKDRTFVKLNCAAIPTGLLESELFGHEKGAFTGAITQRIGRMELADQGTLFLDEVGDIPIEIQPKLLRALQEREFERLGSTHTRRANIRLIAATNRDLEKMIADREFRSDLYYRLNVFPIRVPPLRERKEDIPQLVSYFVQKFARQMQKKIDSISPVVMGGLTTWEWPGNIRELENFIERAVILTRGRSLEPPLGELRKRNTVELPRTDQRDLVEQLAAGRTKPPSDKTSVADEYERKQRDEIIRALTACKGRVGGADGAAARLGIKRSTLQSRMSKLGIYPKQYA
jgi:PAS domain S-box-containing protein